MADCRHNKAVTLIEMLVVLAIIAVVASLAIRLTLRVDNQSKERALDSAFALLSSSLREYYEFKDEFPLQPQQDHAFALDHIELMVRNLQSVPDSRRVLDQLNPALIEGKEGAVDLPELRDPWGTLLDYVYDDGAGDTFPELISAGPDRKFGTADDISSKGRQQN